jgi:hypothetical protein
MISPSWSDYGTYDESAYPDLWDGVVGYWAPCLGPTGLRLHDVSRGNNWGTLTSMDAATDWTVSSGQYSLDFDGSSDHVLLSHLPYTKYANGTIAAWVKSSSDINQTVFAVGNSADSNVLWQFGYGGSPTGTLTNELLWVLLRGFSGATLATVGYTTATRTELIDGNWHHIAVTGNGSSFSLYLDGVSKTLSVSNQYAQSNNGLWFSSIGVIDFAALAAARIGGTVYQYANGNQDDIGLWSRALSASEIWQLYQLGRGGMLQRRSRRRAYLFMPGVNIPILTARNSIIGGGTI